MQNCSKGRALYGPIATVIATVFFIGYIPFAPGTFGTLAAMVTIWLLRPGLESQAVILAVVAIAGVLSAHKAEKALAEPDSKHIVIDEFAGYLVSVFSLPLTGWYLLAAFILFRFFDILKPPPIRNIERMTGGGLGIMLDDIVAGIFTNALLQAWRHFT
jgi:phosphatidylglycerophosphatase A